MYEWVAMKNMKDQQKYSLVTNEERKKQRYFLCAHKSRCRQRIETETKRKIFNSLFYSFFPTLFIVTQRKL